MSDGWALVEIKRLVSIGRVVYTLHARQRMIQRTASSRDVEHALPAGTTPGTRKIEQPGALEAVSISMATS